MAECIVHFEVHENSGDISKLRGLIMNEAGKKPTVDEVKQMLQIMGYAANIEDADQYTFTPAAAGAKWNKIVRKKLDCGEETFTPDLHLKALAESMMKHRNSRPI